MKCTLKYKSIIWRKLYPSGTYGNIEHNKLSKKWKCFNTLFDLHSSMLSILPRSILFFLSLLNKHLLCVDILIFCLSIVGGQSLDPGRQKQIRIAILK